MPKQMNIDISKIIVGEHPFRAEEDSARLLPLQYDLLLRGQVERIAVVETTNGMYTVASGYRRMWAIHKLIADTIINPDLTELVKQQFSSIKCLVMTPEEGKRASYYDNAI